MLINTSQMRSVYVDTVSGEATVTAGAVWSDVISKAQQFGLSPLSGSSSGVGVIGYTLGGGSGWLARLYGFAADSVTAARLITDKGRVSEVTAEKKPELFWAIRGGTSNYGIASSLRFRLYPVHSLYGGGIYWPIDRALEVSELYREWVSGVPEQLTSRLAFVQMPPLPHIPENLRGRWLVAVQGAYAGTETDGAKHFAPFRTLGGAIEDAVKMMPYSAADSIARDPLQPSHSMIHTDQVDAISPDLIRYLLEHVTIPQSPIVSVELRHQGGALSRNPEVPSAVGHRPSGFWLNAIAAVIPPSQESDIASTLRSLRDGIRLWTTGTVQLNGVEVFEADRVRTAYRTEIWDRLRALKGKYDPENRFCLNRNIAPRRNA